MIEYIIDKGDKSNKTNPDNLYSALGDWLVSGEQSGFRRIEWGQDRTYLHKHKDFQRNVDGSQLHLYLQIWNSELKRIKELIIII